jgi:hypothetical protein
VPDWLCDAPEALDAVFLSHANAFWLLPTLTQRLRVRPRHIYATEAATRMGR